MNYIGSNIGAIVAATIFGLVVGLLFLRARHARWTGDLGVVGAIVVVVAEFWLAAILAGALILAPNTAAGVWVMAIGSAVVIWIGFVLPTQVASGLARGATAAAIAFDCAHWLVVMVLQASILQAIGLKHP